jgi:hypothetical protein
LLDVDAPALLVLEHESARTLKRAHDAAGE